MRTEEKMLLALLNYETSQKARRYVGASFGVGGGKSKVAKGSDVEDMDTDIETGQIQKLPIEVLRTILEGFYPDECVSKIASTCQAFRDAMARVAEMFGRFPHEWYQIHIKTADHVHLLLRHVKREINDKTGADIKGALAFLVGPPVGTEETEERQETEKTAASFRQIDALLRAAKNRTEADIASCIRGFPKLRSDAVFIVRKDCFVEAIKEGRASLRMAHGDEDEASPRNLLIRDKDIVLAAVNQDGMALEYAHDDLKDNREVVEAALESEGVALRYASQALKSDKDVILAAVRKNGSALQYVNDEFKQDREVVLAAVKKNGYAFRFASDALKGNGDVVKAAVQQCGFALKFASVALKSDKEIVKAAVRQCGLALEYASEPLKGDKEIVKAAVQQNGAALKYASEPLKGDEEIVKAAVQQNGAALEYASET